MPVSQPFRGFDTRTRGMGLVGIRWHFALITTLALVIPVQAQPPSATNALIEMSLLELAELQITSVARRPQNISHAPASIHVITADDIRRSGATTLPEILRMAPNLQVASRDNVQYAISARGFNNSVGNKLLVLIDGRTVYTPLFSGVFWEMQDTFLQDIERIEVISGPGATLWGANAVNGVINVITRPAADSTGVLLGGEAGDRESGLAARIGGAASGGRLHWRVYAKTRDWDNTRREDGLAVLDAWQKQQVGFRADWRGEGQSFTLQGDTYQGESEHRGFVGTLEIPEVAVSGTNLLARWNRQFGDSELRVQAYWNHSERKEFVLFSPEADIFDLEFQHSFRLGSHQLLWGGGYRHAEDKVAPGVFTAILPMARTLDWQNIFVQDEFALHERLRASAGIKLEWNDYTGMEYLPSVRLGWDLADTHFLWAALSRAVRAPSRFDRDTFFPQNPPFIVAGGPDFVAEVARVTELGYRAQPSSRFTVSATLYHHDWTHLRSGTPLPLPTYLANDIEGEVYGLETWASWQAAAHWRLSGGLTTLKKNLAFTPGSSDTAGVNNATLHNDPDFQWMLRSSHELGEGLTLDLNLRRVAALEVEPVPAYTELNARLAWLPLRNLELALTGRNLLHNDHAQFGPLATRSRIDRAILFGLRWSY